MFQFDTDDNGMIRRIIVLEMTTAFMTKDKYAAASQADKDAGRVMLCDDGAIERIKANRSGLLKYFLEGANDYYTDPRREPPPQMLNSKTKAVKELDEVSRWIKGYLVYDESKKAKVRMADIKNHWKGDSALYHLSAQSRAHGFNEKFLKKVENLHPNMEINIHPDRSNEAYIKHCRIHYEDEDEDDDDEN
jgi:phage/plasmid-associated DNA primase